MMMQTVARGLVVIDVRRSLAADLLCSTPDLWLTCDHFIGTLSAIGQPTRPTQLSLPSLRDRWTPLNGRLGQRVAVWLQCQGPECAGLSLRTDM